MSVRHSSFQRLSHDLLPPIMAGLISVIVKLWLIHLHEEQEKYNLIQCADYQDVIKLLFEHKAKQK